MRLLYLLLFLFLFQPDLLTQRMFQHPIIQLLGPEFVTMSDYNSGVLFYQGLGTRRFRETSNFLLHRTTELHWTPVLTAPNGFGAYVLPYGHQGLQISQTTGQTDLSGGYHWKLPWDMHQNIGFQSQWRQQWQDDNQDGFNDYQNGWHHFIIHNINKSYRGWHLTMHNTYVYALLLRVQEGFVWPRDQLSDSIYGYGSEARQWRAIMRATKHFNKSDLDIIANLQGRKESGAYGQRELASRENRQGIAAIYHNKRVKQQSQAVVSVERQVVEQSWDDWSDNQNWLHLGLGLRHQRFLSSNWLIKAAARLDRHSFAGWQLLPSLRADYLRIKGVRLSALAGRDYRLPRILEESQDYLISQRTWQIGDYGTDQIWFIGAGVQSDIYHIGSIKQQLKLTFRLQYYQQRLLIDPSLESTIVVSTVQNEVPNQHLLVGTLQTQYRNWKWLSALVWQDTQLPYQIGEQQRFFTSKLASLNSITFLRRINNSKEQSWDFRLDHLWRSPQELPNGKQSPHLHDVRVHFETGRKISSNQSTAIKIFTGVENLLNQRQEVLFQNPDAPFTRTFDGSSIRGNALSRRWYVGLRLQL